MLEAGAFKSEKLGDYISDNFVFIKYDLDKSDPDNFKRNYSISAYPTFVFIDGDGKEISRFSGGRNSADMFIELVEEKLEYKNTWAYHDDMLKKDKGYLMTYLNTLHDARLGSRANKLYHELMLTRTLEENLSKEAFEYYNTKVTYPMDVVMVYLLDNAKQARKIMGKKEYDSFIQDKITKYLSTHSTNFASKAQIERAITNAGKYEAYRTPLYHFIKDNIDIIAEKDILATVEQLTKSIKKVDAVNRAAMVNIVTYRLQRNRELKTPENEAAVKKLTEYAKKLDEKRR